MFKKLILIPLKAMYTDTIWLVQWYIWLVAINERTIRKPILVCLQTIISQRYVSYGNNMQNVKALLSAAMGFRQKLH